MVTGLNGSTIKPKKNYLWKLKKKCCGCWHPQYNFTLTSFFIFFN